MSEKELLKLYDIFECIVIVATVGILIFFAIIYFADLAYPQILFRILTFSIFGFLIASLIGIVGKIVINVKVNKMRRERSKK
ncbi:hypothetical protein [Neofamilia massiliensis]|uniref:hypothetical protein n=1 Tax=Neofamilia massiliensis TaxID=1673724 RepID=UPI0006BB55A8|nr:hypothetical protein [Neofamilia massiliensis]